MCKWKKQMRILFVEFAQIQFICYNKYIFIYLDIQILTNLLKVNPELHSGCYLAGEVHVD